MSRVRFNEEVATAAVPVPSSSGMNVGQSPGDEPNSLVFDTAKEACTPRISSRVQYRDPTERASSAVAPASSLSRPNYEDILRRVSVVIHQHISKCELNLSRMAPGETETGLFHASKIKKFAEEVYTSPQYVYHFVRAPISKIGFLYGIRKVDKEYVVPSLSEVHTFLRDLFVKAQLSAECSIGESLSHNSDSSALSVFVRVHGLSLLHLFVRLFLDDTLALSTPQHF
jgi:hypothetical protein